MTFPKVLPLVLAAIVITLSAACGGGETPGPTGAGVFQVGDSAGAVASKAREHQIGYRGVLISEYGAGGPAAVKATAQPGQPYLGFVILPDAKGKLGTLLVLDFSKDSVETVLAWNCADLQTLLKSGGVTDFQNDFCKTTAAR